MKIIAGKYKGRVIPTMKNSTYRPSTSKFKEALFTILSSGKFIQNDIIWNAKVLDLFSGTAALSFEALSRGAKSALLVDIDSSYLKAAKNFANKIGEGKNISCLQSNILNLPLSVSKYNLIFLDPPYYKDLVDKILSNLSNNHYLEKDAITVIELEKAKQIKYHDNFKIVKEKIYGNTKLLILRYEQN